VYLLTINFSDSLFFPISFAYEISLLSFLDCSLVLRDISSQDWWTRSNRVHIYAILASALDERRRTHVATRLFYDGAFRPTHSRQCTLLRRCVAFDDSPCSPFSPFVASLRRTIARYIRRFGIYVAYSILESHTHTHTRTHARTHARTHTHNNTQRRC